MESLTSKVQNLFGIGKIGLSNLTLPTIEDIVSNIESARAIEYFVKNRLDGLRGLGSRHSNIKTYLDDSSHSYKDKAVSYVYFMENIIRELHSLNTQYANDNKLSKSDRLRTFTTLCTIQASRH